MCHRYEELDWIIYIEIQQPFKGCYRCTLIEVKRFPWKKWEKLFVIEYDIRDTNDCAQSFCKKKNTHPDISLKS